MTNMKLTYLCMYVHIYIYIYAYAYAYVCIHVYINVHTDSVHVHMYAAYMHACKHVDVKACKMQANIGGCVRVCTSVDLYECMYVCTHAWMDGWMTGCISSTSTCLQTCANILSPLLTAPSEVYRGRAVQEPSAVTRGVPEPCRVLAFRLEPTWAWTFFMALNWIRVGRL